MTGSNLRRFQGLVNCDPSTAAPRLNGRNRALQSAVVQSIHRSNAATTFVERLGKHAVGVLAFRRRASATLKVVFDPRKVDPTQKVKICASLAAERFDPIGTAPEIESAVYQSGEKIGIENDHSRVAGQKRIFDRNLAAGNGFDVRELDLPAQFIDIVSGALGRKGRTKNRSKRTGQRRLACAFAAANNDSKTGLIARRVILLRCHSGDRVWFRGSSLGMLLGFLQGRIKPRAP